MQFEIEEEERQTVLLALAQMAIARPGWSRMLLIIAMKLQAAEMYEKFKAIEQRKTGALFPIDLTGNHPD
jgi:hypothetical protein